MRNFLHIRHGSRLYGFAVDQFQKIYAHPGYFVQRLFPADKQFCIAFGIQQFKNRAVSSAFNPHHIVRDRRRHTGYKCSAGKLTFPSDFRKRIGIQINLDNRIRINAVNLTV